MMNKWIFVVAVAVMCWLGLDSPTMVPAEAATPTPIILPLMCGPRSKTTKKDCRKRINMCKGFHMRLKWVGPGCKNKKGKKMGDGGCQCKGYCGYTCKKACVRDDECRWEGGKCVEKATGLPGEPIEVCDMPG